MQSKLPKAPVPPVKAASSKPIPTQAKTKGAVKFPQIDLKDSMQRRLQK